MGPFFVSKFYDGIDTLTENFGYFLYIYILENISYLVNMIFRLINRLQPGSVKKINTMKAPFKQVSRSDIIEPSQYKIGVFNKLRQQFDKQHGSYLHFFLFSERKY